MVNLDRFNGSCNTFDSPSSRICVPNKEDVNLKVFNAVTRMNESKTLTKVITCRCKCKFDGGNVIQVKIGITINVDVSAKIR